MPKLLQVVTLQNINLCNEENNFIKPTYVKSRLQLKFFEYSNSLCIRTTRVIVNHVPISKYRLRFFFRENFSCLCGSYPIESRHYILYECKRFNVYWNLRRNSISYFVLFLEFNSRVFSFKIVITQSNQLQSYLISLFLSLLFSFYLILFFLLYKLGFFVHSYKVATMVCPHTSCNKLLI